MKPNELKPNNYIDTPYGEHKLYGISPDCVQIDIEGTVYDFDLDDINPISINKKWLLNLGFRMFKDQGYEFFRIDEDKYRSYRITKCMPNNKKNKLWSVVSHSNGECWEFYSIKYLHQLQNLYFALTELDLKASEENKAITES